MELALKLLFLAFLSCAIGFSVMLLICDDDELPEKIRELKDRFKELDD